MRILNSRICVLDQLAFSHDGAQLFATGSKIVKLATRTDNRGIDVWSVPGDLEPTRHLLSEHVVLGLRVNPAGRWLYVAAKQKGDLRYGYQAVDLSTGEASPLGLASDFDFEFVVLPYGAAFLAAGHATRRGDKMLARWNQPPDRLPVREWMKTPLPNDEPHCVLALDGKRNRVATLNLRRNEKHDYLMELGIFDPASWTLLQRVPVDDKIAMWDQLLFDPSHSHLVLRSRRAFVVWDADDLSKLPTRIVPSKYELTSIAFHPSGRFFAVTSNDTTVKLYDTSTWQLARTYSWNIGRLRSVAFSPDGMLAAAGSDTGRIVVWDVEV